MFYPSRCSGLSMVHMNLGIESVITCRSIVLRHLWRGCGLESQYARGSVCFSKPLCCPPCSAPGRLTFVGCTDVLPCFLSLYLILPIRVTVRRLNCGRREWPEPQLDCFPLPKTQLLQNGSLLESLSLSLLIPATSFFFLRPWMIIAPCCCLEVCFTVSFVHLTAANDFVNNCFSFIKFF